MVKAPNSLGEEQEQRSCWMLRRFLLAPILAILCLLLLYQSAPLFRASAAEVAASPEVRPNGGWGAVWSPRGDQIAFLSSTGGLPDEAWLTDRQGKTFRRLTHGGASALAWSADGRSISYLTTRRGRAERWQVSLDSGHALGGFAEANQEEPQPLPFQPPAEAPRWLSPDGKSLAYVLADEKGRELYLTVNGEPPARLTTGFTVGNVAWSPQGDKIAFDGLNPFSKGLPQVWSYDVAEKKLGHVGSVGSFGPVWSPKGRLIAYSIMSSGPAYFVGITRLESLPPKSQPSPKKRKLDLSKGVMVRNLMYHGDGLAWSPKGDRLAVVVRSAKGQEVWLVKPDGKIAKKFSKNNLLLRFPAWSPDGKRLAFEAMQKGVSAFSEIWITDPKGKSWQDLTPSRPSYWALSTTLTGRVFFLSNEAGVVKVAFITDSAASLALFADTDGAIGVAGSPQGDRLLVLKPAKISLLSADGKSLAELPLTGAQEASFSPSGERVAIGLKTTGEDTIKLLAVAADGALTEVVSLPGSNPSWRSDSSAIAFVRSNLIWRADAEGKNPQALATVPAGEGEEIFLARPVWSPQGDAIVFAVTRSAAEDWQQELWRLSLTEAGAPPPPVLIYREPVRTEFSLSPERHGFLPAWSADGRVLFFSDRGGSPQVWALPAEGGEPVALTPPETLWPACSPDGGRVYFVQPDSLFPLWRKSLHATEAEPLPLRVKAWSVGE